MDRLVLENFKLNVSKENCSEGQTAKYTGVNSTISYTNIIHEIEIRIFTIQIYACAVITINGKYKFSYEFGSGTWRADVATIK